MTIDRNKYADLPPAPAPPRELKGKKITRSLAHNEVTRAYVEKRTEWAERARQAGMSWDDIAKRLRGAGHPATVTSLQQARKRAGLSEPRAPKTALGKVARTEITAVTTLINELVEERVKPLREELLRLRGIEKKYKALKAAFAEDDA